MIEVGSQDNRVNALLDTTQAVAGVSHLGVATGKVWDGQYGNPYRGANVEFWDPNDPFVGGRISTDKNGEFQLSGLPVGTLLRYRVYSNEDELAPQRGEITITNGQIGNVGDVYLPLAAQIFGTVSGLGENEYVYVHLIDVETESVVAVTGPNTDTGRYGFTQVAPGRYAIKLSQYWEPAGLAGLEGDGFYGDEDTASFRPIFWNDTKFGADSLDGAEVVQVFEGDRELGKDISVSKGSMISGTVSIATPDGEVPLRGSRELFVQAFRENQLGQWKKVAETSVNSWTQFGFHIFGLAEGSYKLKFIDSRSGNNSLASNFSGSVDSLEQATEITVGRAETVRVNHVMHIAPPQRSAAAFDLDDLEDAKLAELEDEIAIDGDPAPGSDLSIFVGTEFAGQYVSAFANSTPIVLGDWEQVDSNGYINVPVPEAVPTGDHRFGVQDSSGS
jgi:hypothetical protein